MPSYSLFRTLPTFCSQSLRKTGRIARHLRRKDEPPPLGKDAFHRLPYGFDGTPWNLSLPVPLTLDPRHEKRSERRRQKKAAGAQQRQAVIPYTRKEAKENCTKRGDGSPDVIAKSRASRAQQRREQRR